MISCIETLLEHNFACRESLLDVLERLSHSELVSDQEVGRGSIRNILVHLLETEIYWMSTVIGCGPEQNRLKNSDFENVDSIRRKWKEIETITREMFNNQNEESLQFVQSVRWEDRTVSFTVAKVFIHMATHEVHHRGLIIGLLRKLGYEPPEVNMI